MDNLLLLVLSVIGAFALYWVLFGQWKYNRMMRAEENEKNKNKK